MSAYADTREFFDGDSRKFSSERWLYSPEGVADFRDTLDFISCALSEFRIPAGFSCLELGAGNGFWAPYLRELGCAEYHAADISEKMLSLNPAELKYLCDLNDGLPAEITRKYDVVLAVHSLEYVENIDAALSAALERLADGGCLVAVTKNRRAFVWRAVKHLTDLFAGGGLRQFWRDGSVFDKYGLRLVTRGLNRRIPTMLNNVNDRCPFRPHAGPLRRFVFFRLNPLLRRSDSFAWHIGIAAGREK